MKSLEVTYNVIKRRACARYFYCYICLMKIYLDTSIYGGCFDEGMEASNQLIEWINDNPKVVVYYSDVLDWEIKNAPVPVRKRLRKILRRIRRKKYIKQTAKSKNLAGNYLAMGVLSPDSPRDAQHIAVASLNKIDYILSWNYKDMVKREQLFMKVNKLFKVHAVQIIKPNKFLDKYGKSKRRTLN